MSSKEEASNPLKVLTKEVLELALKTDLGQQWSLVDHELKNFTKAGDNYQCLVTNVTCKAVCGDEQMTTSYIVKINPPRVLTKSDQDMKNEFFVREGLFFNDIAVALNTILRELNLPLANFPECLYTNFERGKEIIITKDLRKNGFKMIDKTVGMDSDHSTILLKDLARLHASSAVFKQRLGNEKIMDHYPFLCDRWLQPGNESRDVFENFMKDSIDITLKVIQKLGGYNKQYRWLSSFKHEAMDVYTGLLTEAPENLRMIIHGDCWSNNMLFRYDEEKNPIEVALLDLALCRFCSPGIDLNYYFYTSLSGEYRRANYDQLLAIYLDEFKKVFAAAGLAMPFTDDEFRKEVLGKSLYGIISSFTDMPMVICDSEKAPDFSMNDSNPEQFMKEYSEFIVNMLDNTPAFKSQFIAVLEDIEEQILD